MFSSQMLDPNIKIGNNVFICQLDAQKMQHFKQTTTVYLEAKYLLVPELNL